MQHHVPIHCLRDAALQIKEAADDAIIQGVCDAILAMPRHHGTAVFLFAAGLTNAERTQAYLAQDAIEELAEELATDGTGPTMVSAFDDWLSRQPATVQFVAVAGIGAFFVMLFAFCLKMAA